MKIAKVESLHADAGHRNFDFLKITTDDGFPLGGGLCPPSDSSPQHVAAAKPPLGADP